MKRLLLKGLHPSGICKVILIIIIIIIIRDVELEVVMRQPSQRRHLRCII